MTNKHEQKFLDALRDIFVGAKIEGDSGYINLMKIKSRYYTEGVFPKLMEKIELELNPFPNFREELFDKLYSFFKRYFSESGSIYFRHTPYYQDIYERIYTDDRDVMLFWKTQNLYYVKTDRLFRSMTLSLDDAPDQKYLFDATAVAKQSFNFDASTLQNKRNNEKRSLIFEYLGLSETETLKFGVNYAQGVTKTKTDDILKAIKKDGVKVSEEQLNRAFRLFERQTEVDFFINKNAKAFLNEQFDLWMYQYLFKRESDWTETRIAEMQALKRVAYSIIEFISQFEDELVRIWNKPKFALSSNYVITFDKVFERNENLARKLLKHEGITAQIEEWKQLGIIDDNFTVEKIFEVETKNGELFGDEAENSQLSTLNSKLRFLPFDTLHFKSLEIEILSLFDNLDEELDGRLIHSENYQALNTLKDKFRKRVKSIYIDPPYNREAKDSEILYVNNYKNSSWLCMVDNRLNLSKEFFEDEAILCVAIDDFEMVNLCQLLDQKFIDYERNTIVINHHPQGGGGTNVSQTHEYAVLMIPKDKNLLKGEKKEDNTEHRSFMRSGTAENNFRKGRQNSFYAVLVDPNTKEVMGVEPPPIGDGYPRENTAEGWLRIYPISRDGSERVWRKYYLTASKSYKKKIICSKNNTLYEVVENKKKRATIFSNWTEKKYNAGTFGTNLLSDLFSESSVFAYPKSLFAVKDLVDACSWTDDESFILDFFGGSGTTAHAVINLNRDEKYEFNEDDFGKRKYILVEANDYFYTVILPRVKKVVFSDKWKDGKAQEDGKGVSHFCKYFALEQYEDTLRRAVYLNDSETDSLSFFDNPFENPFASYVFLRDKKMSDALKVDYEANKIKVDFEKLYDEIDLAETLSCVKGKFIKSVTAESVTFADGETINYNELDYRDILPLLWWDK